MIIFQVPAGAPEHNSLAVKIGTGIEQHLRSEFAVLYDTYTYVPHSELEKMGHFKNKEYFVFETGKRSGSLLQAYQLVPDPVMRYRFEQAHFDRSVKLLYSDSLKVEFPVDWKL